MGTCHQDWQAGQLPQGKGQMGTARFQMDYLQTDSPASTWPGFRMSCQMAASKSLGSFPESSQYSFLSRTTLWCESWCRTSIATRSRSSAILLQDWRNLHTAWTMLPDAGGTFLTRHCVPMAWYPHELIDVGSHHTAELCKGRLTESRERSQMEAAFAKTLDPMAGSPATGKSVAGIINLFVDDLFGTGGNEMEQRVLTRLRTYFQVGPEDWNDVAFTGQRIRWTQDSQNGRYIEVSQSRKGCRWDGGSQWNETRRKTHLPMHTMYRRVLGQINWLHSRTVPMLLQNSPDAFQWHFHQQLAMWSLSTNWRDMSSHSQWIFSIGHSLDHWEYLDFPDASNRNNDDGSSQRGMTVFLAESRERSSRDWMTNGSLIDLESQKIK